jgi:hypothetical protein
MKIKITVVGSEAEYNTWLATQVSVVAPPAAAPTEDGAAQKDTSIVKPNSVSIR